jgi:MoaA/NifB/PqqE/SkfB family radical SAM enzyme
MVEHMSENLAFLSKIKSNNKISHDELLTLFQNNYKSYRKSWYSQANDCFEKSSYGPDLLKQGYHPLCIDIETAAICDLACPFCYRESLATPDKIINEQLFKNIVDQAAEMGVPSMKFNYRGEPLMHPKLPKMINYAKKKGILETIINTNATHLTEEVSKSLIDAGLDFMIYSFDGGTKETYEKMRPGRFKKNNFEDVYDNIVGFSNVREKMNAKFPRTKIQMILTKEAYSEQASFYDLFHNCVDEVTVTQYSERGGNIEDLSVSDKKTYKKLCNDLNLPIDSPYLRKSDGSMSISDSRVPCGQPFQRMFVTYDGRVAMCCEDWGAMHPIGYVSNDSFKDEDADKNLVLDRINSGRKGFELMSEAILPPKHNKPKKVVQTLSEIWTGHEVETVRRAHGNNKANEISICKNCTFKDTYNWVS